MENSNETKIKAERLIVEAELEAKRIIDRAKEAAKGVLVVAKNDADNKLYIDMSRIPLICQSIVQIDKNIGNIMEIIKEQYSDHESRIRTLENSGNKSKGLFDGISLSWSVVITIITIAIAILAIIYGINHGI
jgi:hypothetical protein